MKLGGAVLREWALRSGISAIVAPPGRERNGSIGTESSHWAVPGLSLKNIEGRRLEAPPFTPFWLFWHRGSVVLQS